MNNTPTRPQGARDKKETPMDLRSEIILQIVLFSVGLLVSFPIILAIFTSFKVPQDITNYPPTLLPRQNVRVEVEGFDEPLRIYDVEIDGETLRLAEAEREAGQVFLIDPENPETVYEVARTELIPVTRIRFT
ncbi:MAG: hypothetical protein AAFQ07_17500, partial [Chloroflexota bacterium]